MDAVEYLLFIPLLIYGMALSDLFGEWKKIFTPSKLYIPYALTILFITEIGIYNVYIFFNISDMLAKSTYFIYLLYLLPPLVFLLMVNLITQKEDTIAIEEFFKSKIKPVFILVALFVALHFVPHYHFDNSIYFPRILAIAFCLLYAFWQKQFLFYIIIGVWVLSIIVRISTAS